MTFEIRNVFVQLDANLPPNTMKEIGFVNGEGRECVTEIVVGKEVYAKLWELYGKELQE